MSFLIGGYAVLNAIDAAVGKARQVTIGLNDVRAMVQGEAGFGKTCTARWRALQSKACPSLVEAPMTKFERERYKKNEEEEKEEDAVSNPNGRIAVPDDVVHTAIWLLSSDAHLIKEQNFRLTGLRPRDVA